ncbi:hypothetical protein MES5069_370064 [Mesorhizobium escarrei]|uniref:Uncharacterized protein n=1 Tax=Mesorhizobium escarrei TaxID=666018 RepID=A0ABN8K221_9HYPH|nr:hypothetical protein MES5069_370064 [Mesorhizobium escarrei]
MSERTRGYRRSRHEVEEQRWLVNGDWQADLSNRPPDKYANAPAALGATGEDGCVKARAYPRA